MAGPTNEDTTGFVGRRHFLGLGYDFHDTKIAGKPLAQNVKSQIDRANGCRRSYPRSPLMQISFP